LTTSHCQHSIICPLSEKKHPLGGCCGECYRKEEEEAAGPKSKSCHSPPLKKAKIDSSDEVEEESDFGDFTVKQKQDTRSPSHSSGDDQDEDEEPPSNNPEEFAYGSYIEFIEALNERDNRLFTNVPFEVALQNIKELIEKEAGCSEEVKYTLEDVETYYEELEESEVTLNRANALLSISDCLIICIDEYEFFNICRVLISHTFPTWINYSVSLHPRCLLGMIVLPSM